MEGATIVDCNLKALNIFGLDKKEDILGKTPFDFSPQEQYNGENSYKKGQKNLEIAHKGISQRFKWKHIRKDGTGFDTEISLNPFEVDDQKLIHVVINDITEKLKKEELEKEVEIAKRSSKIKEQFLANMSHEIRTPLNSIIGFIDLFKKTNLDNRQRDFLEMIDESSGLLLNLINDILDISKIEAGKLVLYPKTIDVCSIFAKVESLFKYSAKQKKNTLWFDCNNLEKYFIKIDETRFLQVITNLVSNAVKFTNNGSIDVKLFKIKEFGDKVHFRIEVTDTGIGIAKENQTRLFDFFSQVDANLTSNIKGAGLGLAISKQLVSLMDGEIGVESEPGKGSKFWFTFKAKKTEEKPELENIKVTSGKEPINMGITILLAEDKILNQKVVSMMLQNAGCKVEIANNVLEALELFSENKFDIILMDIHMPDMDGITALNQLKEKYKQLPPVIGLSASAMEGDAEKYINKGLDDYLAKPVKFNDLYHKIMEWL
jgi:PAS domain S-box-containing protein